MSANNKAKKTTIECQLEIVLYATNCRVYKLKITASELDFYVFLMVPN